MLSTIRKASRSWVAAILIGLLVISFALFGINDVFRGAIGNDLAVIDGKPVTQQEFRAEFDRMVKGASEQGQREVTTAEAREGGLDTRTLDQLVADRVFGAYTERLGIVPTEEQLQTAIAGIERFQDPQTRQFSQAAYQQALQELEMTPVDFESRVRVDLGRQMLLTAALAGMTTPKVLARQVLAYATERRDVTIIPVPATLVGGPATPTDAQVQALYNESREALMQPETRDLTLVSAEVAGFEAGVTIDEAQIRAVFEQRKDLLGTPARVSFVQIVAPDMTKARAAADRLRRGEPAEAVARALGLGEPLTYTDTPASDIRDGKVAGEVMKAGVGDVIAIDGSLGKAAVRITGVLPAVAANYEEFAASARQQFREQAAAQALTVATEAYDAAIEEGASVAEAARRAGFTVTAVKAVTAQGVDPRTGQPLPELAEAGPALAQAFGLAQGDATELSPAGADRYVALVVDAITPSAPPPLASIRAEVVQEWQRRDLAKRLEARGKELLEAAKKDGLEVAARAANLPVRTQPEPLQRGQGGQALTNAVFGAKAGEIVLAPVANGVEYAVIRVDRISRDDEAAAGDRLAQAGQQVQQSLQSDLVSLIQKLAAAFVDVKSYPERIAAAFGDAPSDTPAETPAGAGAAASPDARKEGDSPEAAPAGTAPPAEK
jgi:peptidyl-prolyl cis-trans isomerase D